MIRGSTPDLVFTLPFSADTVKNITVSFADSNERLVLVKYSESCTFEDDNVILHLEQEDTLKLPVGSVSIQLKVLTKDNKLIPSKIISAPVGKILDESVLE